MSAEGSTFSGHPADGVRWRGGRFVDVGFFIQGILRRGYVTTAGMMFKKVVAREYRNLLS